MNDVVLSVKINSVELMEKVEQYINEDANSEVSEFINNAVQAVIECEYGIDVDATEVNFDNVDSLVEAIYDRYKFVIENKE